MKTFRLGEADFVVPSSEQEYTHLQTVLSSRPDSIAERSLLVAFSSDSAGRLGWGAAMGERAGLLVDLLFALIDRPRVESGFIEVRLSPDQVGILRTVLEPAAPSALRGVVHLLSEADAERRAVTAVLLFKSPEGAREGDEYQRRRTTLLFELFNAGALRGTDSAARQSLLDSFTILPNRFLSEGGQFIVPAQEDPVFLRRVSAYTEWSGAIAELSPGGIDKFPSLMSVRAHELMLDGNRIVPSVMIRDGVHVGKRNIFMFHAAVNIAAFIGDDNLIDSHASLASSAQVGNRNKIGSFVSVEGVLSPANAAPVVIGDENFLGSFVRIGTGIRIGNKNFIGAGVNLSLGTKLKDCRSESSTRGEYVTVREINERFDALAITPNNAVRDFEGVGLLPGEYVIFENTPDFMGRFEGDVRIRGQV
jgi:acetyltransferase-like isoleucine patch superfamily enzyme